MQRQQQACRQGSVAAATANFFLFALLGLTTWLIPTPAACNTPESKTLQLTEVLHAVRQSYPLIRTALIDLERAGADYLAAQGGFDPRLTSSNRGDTSGEHRYLQSDTVLEQPTALLGSQFYGGYRISQGDFPVYQSQLMTFNQGEFRAGLELPLLKGRDIDERRFRLAFTEQGRLVQQQSLELQKIEVTKQATHRYWDWVAAGKKLAIARELLTIALMRGTSLTHRVKHGDSPEIDFIDNERAVMQRQATVTANERLLQKATLELSLFWRDERGSPVLAATTQIPQAWPAMQMPQANDLANDPADDPKNDQAHALTEPSTAAAAAPAPFTRFAVAPLELERIAQHPEMQRFSLITQQLSLESRLAANQLQPKLDFYLGLSRDLGVNPGSPYLPLDSYPLELKAGLTLEFPLLFRSARGKSQSALLALDRISLQQKLGLDRLKVQFLDASQAIHAALVKTDFIRSEIKFSRQLEVAEGIRLKHGDSSLFLINLREQATQDALLKEVESVAEFHKACADRLAALGSSQLPTPSP